jgi:oligoendopeptidase F
MSRYWAVVFIVFAAAGSPAAAAPDDPGATWDLSDLYPSAAAWDSERTALEKEVAGIARFKGTLGRDAKSMLTAFDTIALIDKRLARLAVHASLKSDEDVRVAQNQARNQAAANLSAKLGEATAWIRPEVLRLGAAKVEAFIAIEPGLKKNSFLLRDTLRGAPHTLSPESEDVLAQAGNALGQPANVYSIFANGELPFPTVTLADGKSVKLDQAA